MLPDAADFAQSQVTVVGDLSHGESRPIPATRNHTTRRSTSLPQQQIAERVALPAAHHGGSKPTRQMFPTRRRIELNPASQGVCRKLLVDAVLRYDQVIGKQD